MSGALSWPGQSTYQPVVNSAEAANGIPNGLLTALIGAESSFNPTAQNGNASGIAQFMPGTAEQYGVSTSDPNSSINGAGTYLSALFSQTGSWTGALQSYGTIPSDISNTGTLTAGQLNALQIAQAADNGNIGAQSVISGGQIAGDGTGTLGSGPAQTAASGPAAAQTNIFNTIKSALPNIAFGTVIVILAIFLVIAGVFALAFRSGMVKKASSFISK